MYASIFELQNIYKRGSIKVDVRYNRFPYFVQMRLSTASEKCVASTGRIVFYALSFYPFQTFLPYQ